MEAESLQHRTKPKLSKGQLRRLSHAWEATGPLCKANVGIAKLTAFSMLLTPAGVMSFIQPEGKLRSLKCHFFFDL